MLFDKYKELLNDWRLENVDLRFLKCFLEYRISNIEVFCLQECFFVSKPASFSSRLSFRLIFERTKQQPSNEMAQAAVEKIRR